jgi:PBP1b-binding outer membrane lipoprotein LpoB
MKIPQFISVLSLILLLAGCTASDATQTDQKSSHLQDAIDYTTGKTQLESFSKAQTSINKINAIAAQKAEAEEELYE